MRSSFKNLSVGYKILLVVIVIVLLGEIVFTAFALHYSREFLIKEMQQTLVGFSRTVALDIARGYEVSNTRSLYSLLDELEHFDTRIISLSVIDSTGSITADLESEHLFTHDSSNAVSFVLQNKTSFVEFDEETKRAVTAVPVVTSHAGMLIGVFKATFSIEELYEVLSSLQTLITIVSVVVFIFLIISILTITRVIIVKPLQDFLPALERIEKGDFSLALPVKNNDEINVLAKHVNRMASGLKEREFVKDTFSRYVPKEVVDQIMEKKIRPHLEGELRNVTVFFSDIRGFTKMTERLGAEQIVKMLNRYFTAMTEVVLQFEGIIDKFAGDEIMVVFGAPVHHDDDPLRAVRMGLAMQKRMQSLNEEFAKEGMEKISIGIGINSGTAIAGNIGSEKRLTYSVIGDDVNLASRLVERAGPREIIISDATHELVKEYFHCKSLGELNVKGKTHPVAMYLVMEEQISKS
ncbi:MAG: HAMP domain-containing protein [Ignavibacteriae bacterium]|nr:HAMP domain-containing protein [Ignavibacteriota bacterium]